MKIAYKFLPLLLLAVVLWSATDAWAGPVSKAPLGKVPALGAGGRSGHLGGNLDTQGGPDAFGYHFVDNQGGDTVQYQWIELVSGGGTFIDFTGNEDDAVQTLPLPFSFPFYGGSYTNVTVSTNGNVQFAATSEAYSNECLPSVDIGGPAVFALWDDLHLSNGGHNPGGATTVCYRFTADMAVIEWDSIGRYDDDGGSFKFQVILYPDGRIKLQYANLTWGTTSQSQTIGIQGGATGPALEYVCDEDGTQPVSGLAILFYQTGTGSIVGVVQTEAGEPIYQAMVRLDELSVSAVADAQGAYAFPMVPPGTYTMSASRTGYSDLVVPGVVVTENNQTVQDFTLLPSGGYTFTSADVPRDIPDLGQVTSIIVVEPSLLIGDVDVRLDIQHTYCSDLRISLQSPGGETVLLIEERGSSGENFTNTVLDDEATQGIAQGTAPFTGSYRPEQRLSVWDGDDAQDTWTLTIEDLAGQDVGQLLGWEITVSTPQAAEPEPVVAQSCALLGNYPNPFNASTEIRFSLAQQGPVRLVLYNVLGQELRTLVDGARPAGIHRVSWDGTDGAGRAAASGLYLMRLEAGGRSFTGKLLLAR